MMKLVWQYVAGLVVCMGASLHAAASRGTDALLPAEAYTFYAKAYVKEVNGTLSFVDRAVVMSSLEELSAKIVLAIGGDAVAKRYLARYLHPGYTKQVLTENGKVGKVQDVLHTFVIHARIFLMMSWTRKITGCYLRGSSLMPSWERGWRLEAVSEAENERRELAMISEERFQEVLVEITKNFIAAIKVKKDGKRR